MTVERERLAGLGLTTSDEAPSDGYAHDTDGPPPDRASRVSAPAWLRRVVVFSSRLPWVLVAGITVAGTSISVAVGRIRDIDLYWHLIVGDQIRAGTPVTEAGHGWSFAPGVADTWVSSQWLAEVVLSWLHDVGGFHALVLYRVVTVLAALAVLAAVTLRGRPVRAAVVPYALGGIALASTSQERSQQLTYILAPLVGWWAERLLRDGRLPRWWLVLPLTVVWANYHGGWILLPFTLVVVAVSRWVDHGWRDRAAPRAILLAAGCGLAAMVSPLGPANALTAITFSRAASEHIVEWDRVKPWSDQGWQLAAVLVVVIVCWAWGRTRPGRGELVFVLALLAFGFLAYRNITPTILILAPMLVGVIDRVRPGWRADPPRPLFTRISWAIAALGAAAAVVIALLPGTDLHQGRGVDLMERVAEHPGQVRVLNTYNAAGPLLWFGGGPGHVKVAIDGRTDRYGAAYIDSYLDTLLAARPGWQAMFDRLDPDAAVLYSNDALTSALKAERDWRQLDYDDGFVLLVPPDATGW